MRRGTVTNIMFGEGGTPRSSIFSSSEPSGSPSPPVPMTIQHKLPNFFIVNGQQRITNTDHEVWKIKNVFPGLSVDTRYRLGADGSTNPGYLTANPTLTANDYGGEVTWLKQTFDPIFTAAGKTFRYSVELRGIGQWWINPICTYFMRHPDDAASGQLAQSTVRIFLANGKADTKTNWSDVFFPAFKLYLDNNSLPDPFVFLHDIENTVDAAGFPNEAYTAAHTGWMEKSLLDVRAETETLDNTSTLSNWYAAATDINGEALTPFDAVTMGGNNYPHNADCRDMGIDAWKTAYQYGLWYSIINPAKTSFPNVQAGEWDQYSYSKAYPMIERPFQYHYLNSTFLPDLQMPSWYGDLPFCYAGTEPTLLSWPHDSWPTEAHFIDAYGLLLFEEDVLGIGTGVDTGTGGIGLATLYDPGSDFERAALYIAKNNAYAAAGTNPGKRLAPSIGLQEALVSNRTMENYIHFCWLLGAENFYVFASNWDSNTDAANRWHEIITAFNLDMEARYGIADVIVTPTIPQVPIGD